MQKKNKHIYKAIKYYRRALKIDKKNAAIHYNLGNVFSLIGDNKNSIHHLKLAVLLEPNSKNYFQTLLFITSSPKDASFINCLECHGSELMQV